MALQRDKHELHPPGSAAASGSRDSPGPSQGAQLLLSTFIIIITIYPCVKGDSAGAKPVTSNFQLSEGTNHSINGDGRHGLLPSLVLT